MLKVTRALMLSMGLAALPLGGVMAQSGDSGGGGSEGPSLAVPSVGPGGARTLDSTANRPSASEPAVQAANPSVSTPSGIVPSNNTARSQTSNDTAR